MPHAVQRRKMICIIGIGYDDVTASFDEQIPPNELFLITNDSVNTINSTKEQSKYIVDFSQHIRRCLKYYTLP